MNTVIFACVHNAGRSQMAAALFNAMADSGKARAVSAGTQPGDRVHPEVIAVMREIVIDLSKVAFRTVAQPDAPRRKSGQTTVVSKRATGSVGADSRS